MDKIIGLFTTPAFIDSWAAYFVAALLVAYILIYLFAGRAVREELQRKSPRHWLTYFRLIWLGYLVLIIVSSLFVFIPNLEKLYYLSLPQ